MEARAKIIYDKAARLAKYDSYNAKKVFKKGLVKKDSVTRAEFKHMTEELLHQVNALDPYQAQRVSTIIRAFPDAEKVIIKLKEFNRTMEKEGAKETPSSDATPEVSVVFIDVASRFERIEAIFTGTRLTELYADDAYHRKCEEIELLLEGRDAEKPLKRDVGQHDEISELAELLKVCIPNRSSSMSNAPPAGTVPNTARGVGGPWGPPPASARGEPGPSGFMETPRGSVIDPTPKCLTARRAAEESGGRSRLDSIAYNMQQPIPGHYANQAQTVSASQVRLPEFEPQYAQQHAQQYAQPSSSSQQHSPVYPQNQAPQYSNPLQPQANIDPFAEPSMSDPFSAPSFPDTVTMSTVGNA